MRVLDTQSTKSMSALHSQSVQYQPATSPGIETRPIDLRVRASVRSAQLSAQLASRSSQGSNPDAIKLSSGKCGKDGTA